MGFLTDDVKTQKIIDNFYKQNGKCCAGCDWWRWHNSIVGECIGTVPVAGKDRVSMLGIHNTSLQIESGHIMTKRDHVCGEFQDNN